MYRLLLLSFLFFLQGCGRPHLKEGQVKEIWMSAMEACQEKAYSAAIQKITAIDELYAYPEILETLAFAYEANQQLWLAANTFEQLFYVDIKKQYSESIFYAAQIYEQLQLYSAAARCYRLCIESFPKDEHLWFALSQVEFQEKNYTKALSSYLNGMALQTRSLKMEDFFRLSQLCFFSDLFKEANFWAKQSLKKQPHSVEILAWLLKIADVRKHTKAAEKWIRYIEKEDSGYLEKLPDIKGKYCTVNTTMNVVATSKKQIEITVKILHHLNLEVDCLEIFRKFKNLCPPYIY